MAMMQTARTVLLLVVLAMWMPSVESMPGGLGGCPQIPVQRNFRLRNYMGTWYEYQRFPTAREILIKCGQGHHTLIDDTSFYVNNTGIREIQISGSTVFKKPTGAAGIATTPDLKDPAKLVFTFGGQILSYLAQGDYWVLATDYKTYSLAYSCYSMPLGAAHVDATWILTRERGVAPPNLDDLYDILRDNGVDPSHFFTVEQTDC